MDFNVTGSELAKALDITQDELYDICEIFDGDPDDEGPSELHDQDPDQRDPPGGQTSVHDTP